MSIQWENTSSGLQHYLDSDGVLRTGFDSTATSEDFEHEYKYYCLLTSKAQQTQTIFDRVCYGIAIIAVVALLVILFLN